MPQPSDQVVEESPDSSLMNEAFDEMDSALDQVFKDLGVPEEPTQDSMMQDAFDEMDSALDKVFTDLGVDENE